MSRVVGVRGQVALYFGALALGTLLLMACAWAALWWQGTDHRLQRLQVAAETMRKSLEQRDEIVRERLADTRAARNFDAVVRVLSSQALPFAAVYEHRGNKARSWHSADWLKPSGASATTNVERRYQQYQGQLFAVWEQRSDELATLIAYPLDALFQSVILDPSIAVQLVAASGGEQWLNRRAEVQRLPWRVTQLPSSIGSSHGPALGLTLYAYPHLPVDFWLIGGVALVVMALLVALLVWRFSAALSRPLVQLSRQLQQYAEGGDLAPVYLESRTVELLGLKYALDSVFDLLRRREKGLRYRATHDLLTGMKNQNELLRIVEERIRDAKAHDQAFHLIGINILNFREINDMFGPDVADRCLVNIGALLERDSYVAARFYRGGIVVVKEGPPDDVAAVVLAMQLSRHHGIKNIDIELSVCTAIVGFPGDADQAPSLLRRLEIALDGARRAPYRFQRYQVGLEENYVRRLNMVEELRKAMLDWQSGLQVFYQPKLNLRNGRIERMEALLRWQHPKYGQVAPSEFIPLAEQAGLISALSSWVIKQVCEQIAAWHERGLDIQVAINLSVQDMSHPELLDVIEKHRRKHELSADALAFEITESELMENPQEAVRLLKTFRERGYCLAIDDFGTGYSSLTQVKHMPVNEIKIDQEFVRELPRDDDDKKIVRTTLALARNFGLEAVAEGVEDLETLELLTRWGCGWAQGYYISAAMPGVDVVDWVDDFHARHRSDAETLSYVFACEQPEV